MWNSNSPILLSADSTDANRTVFTVIFTRYHPHSPTRRCSTLHIRYIIHYYSSTNRS